MKIENVLSGRALFLKLLALNTNPFLPTFSFVLSRGIKIAGADKQDGATGRNTYFRFCLFLVFVGLTLCTTSYSFSSYSLFPRGMDKHVPARNRILALTYRELWQERMCGALSF